jgi:hypothetical protein
VPDEVTLRQHLEAIIASNDARYEQRFKAQETAVAAAFAAQEKAIAAALSAVKEATERLASAFEVRMANTNEWRGTVESRDRLFMPRAEAEAIINSVKSQLDALTLAFREQRSNSSGMNSGWSLAIAVVGFVALLVGIFLRWKP